MLRSSRRGTGVVILGMAAVTLAVGAIAYHSTSASTTAGSDRAGLMAADTGPGRPPAVPANLVPPAGLHRIGTFSVVTGTQTYTCANGSFAGASVPEAVLAGPGGRIHHFAGPSWQSLKDQSLVTASKTAESAVTGSIPQLLLTATSHTGTGLLSRVQNIQRLNTSGGAAPATACTDGAKTSVPYHATYVFWAN
jgi:hypothetical protein